MLTGELVRLQQVSPVTCLADLEGLLAPERREEAAALVSGYLAGSPPNAYALEALVSRLGEGKGGAFLVSGLYGSGKSHLLTVLGLLALEPELWPTFADSHPELSRLSAPTGPSLVVALPLDEAGPGCPLESLVFSALQRRLARALGRPVALAREEVVLAAWERYLLPAHGDDFAAWSAGRPEEPPAHRVLAYLAERSLPLQVRWDRAEALSRLGELAAEAGIARVLVLLDEVGMHLAAAPRPQREQDASFLQFLAQATRSFPLLLVGTLPRTLEDLGEIESHTLRQIRDRFSTLHLGCEHLREVVSRRLIVRPDPARLEALLGELHQRWSDGRRLYFGREDLLALYPLHPLALELLCALAGRALSQTRSLMQLAPAAASSPGRVPLSERLFPALLTPPDLFAAFGPELLALPECHAQRRLHQLYLDNWDRVGFADPELARAGLETLLLCSLAGLRWSVAEVADSLLGSGLDPTRSAVLAELEAMERFAGVRLERGREPESHQVVLETESDHGELLRRRLNDLVDSFQPGDSRVWQAALAACTGAGLPLAALSPEGSALVEWQNTRRPVQVSVGPLPGPAALANLLDHLAQPHCPRHGALFLAVPGDPEAQRAAWREVLPPPDRFSPALLCWLPRPLREREWAILAEHAAVAILLSGPMPREGKQGEELRALLGQRQQWLAGAATELLRALYWEGQVLDGEGEEAADPARLAAAADFPGALTLLLGEAWARVYPQSAACAPGVRWYGPQRNRSLLAGLVLPGACAQGPVLDQARTVLAPLGLVALEAQGAAILPAGPAARFLLDHLPPAPAAEPEAEHCLSVEQAYGLLARSELGLVPEQAELVVAVLARTGSLLPLDAFLQPVALQSDQPVGDYVRFLALPPPPDPALTDLAGRLARAAFGREPRGDQLHQLWDVLLQWRQAVERRSGELEGRLRELAAALGQDPLQWSSWQEVLIQAAHLAAGINPALPPPLGLRALAGQVGEDPAETERLLIQYRLLRAFLDRQASRAGELHAFLHREDLCLPKGSVLVAARRRLLAHLADPQGLVTQCERWSAAADSFLACYSREYAAWHAHAYGPSRYRPLLALREAPEWVALRALERLPVAVADSYPRLEAILSSALAGHCPGAPLELPASPVCPRCSLVMTALPELPDPAALLAAARQGVAAYLAALAEPERRERIERALQVAPPPPPLRRQLQRALAFPPEAPPERVAAAFTSEVVDFLAAALRRRPTVRRRSADLVASLAGREMTKGDATRLFTAWLDPEQALGDADYLAVD